MTFAFGGISMTPEKTIALWQRCEEARAAELAAGKSFREAHEAAKRTWNDWALPLVERRDKLIELALLSYRTEQPKDVIAPRKIPNNDATKSAEISE